MFQNSTQSEIFVTEKYPKADFNFFLRIIRVFMETALEIIFESKETVLTKNTVWWLEKESHHVEVEYHLLYLLHYRKTWFPTCQVSACPAFLEEMNFYSTVLISSWITRLKILVWVWKIPVAGSEGAVFCEAVTRNEKLLAPGCGVLLQKDPLGESSDSCVGKLSGSRKKLQSLLWRC